MIRRARLLSVLGVLAPGALMLIGSTQTWIHVALRSASASDLTVAGADAVTVLAPLSLAVLALGLALSIVGTVLRYVFGALSVAAGVGILALVVPVVTGPPVGAYAGAVTDATGITGDTAVAELVATRWLTAWPVVTAVAALVLVTAGLFVLVTARRWVRGGRKYEATARDHAVHTDPSRPLDAIDSWDDLSRGDDPTTDGPAR
ncbi:Trp biosynthesis-associated membrane protein [Microbacterium sp. GXF7504]